MSSSVESALTERRLHPLSWLFTLIGQLKQFALPLVFVVITGRRANADFYSLIGVGVLVAYSVAQYFTYRYRIETDGVVVRSGLFQRSLRHVPFARIQNVTVHQNVLHRIFGVAEVKLESAAGGPRPEAQMRVLRLDAAHELERLVRQRVVPAGDSATTEATDAAPPLLALSTGEVIRLGLINNRGMLVVGGLFAFMAQAGDNLLGKFFTSFGHWLSGQAGAMHLTALGMLGASVILIALMLIALRVLSVSLALLHFHGFTLREDNGRLSVERGLLTRTRGSVPRQRIQAFSLTEGLLHRWFGRRSLRVDTAVMEAVNDKAVLGELAPIAPPARIDALVDHLLQSPSAPANERPRWPIETWQPLHPRAWRRKFSLPALLVFAATIVVSWLQGPWGLLLLALVPLLALRATWWARHSAYSVAQDLIAFRSGWLDRQWRFAECQKLQAVEWVQSPFDRRHGMATLRFDTAGASPMASALAIPYLPEADARAIYEQLAAKLR